MGANFIPRFLRQLLDVTTPLVDQGFLRYDAATGMWETVMIPPLAELELPNNYVNSENYEQGFARWDSNVFKLGVEKFGTGLARNMVLRSSAGVDMLTIPNGGFDVGFAGGINLGAGAGTAAQIFTPGYFYDVLFNGKQYLHANGDVTMPYSSVLYHGTPIGRTATITNNGTFVHVGTSGTVVYVPGQLTVIGSLTAGALDSSTWGPYTRITLGPNIAYRGYGESGEALTAHKFTTSTTLALAGSNLASWSNGEGAPLVKFDKSGSATFTDQININGTVYAADLVFGGYSAVGALSSGAGFFMGTGVKTNKEVANSLLKTSSDEAHYFYTRYDLGLEFHTGITGASGSSVPDNTNKRMQIVPNGDIYIYSRFLNANGTAATPAYSFWNDADTGMYLNGGNSLGLSAGGTEGVRLSSTDAWMKHNSLILGSAAAVILSTTVTNNLSVNADTEITNSAYGFILRDRTTADRYRLKVTSGVLGLELAA